MPLCMADATCYSSFDIASFGRKKAALGGWTGFVFKSPFDKNQKARNVLAVQAKSANAVVMTSVAVLTSPVAVSCG